MSDPLADFNPFFPDDLVALLVTPDAMEVMSVRPNNDAEVEEDEDGPTPAPALRGSMLDECQVRGTATVPTAERRAKLGRAVVRANREAPGGGGLCFSPHHGVRATRGNETAELLICFWCGSVWAWGPGRRFQSYGLGRSAKAPLARELRRGGVGWLWVWRRWLGI